ncbi:MAG TPA: acylphosphatase [Thiotrichales bacterium]|nr:acylphosphatase [Thiotrichales bacterium]
MSVCRRCRVTGRVHGVFFRDSTRRKALELGLCGSAVNMPDGSVEVLVCGEPEAVSQLCTWLWEGPPMARVESVTCAELPPLDLEGFSIG